MKPSNLILTLGACLATFGAQAGITQIPPGPLQVTLNYANTVTSTNDIDNLSPPEPLSFDLTALGNSHMAANKTWVADATQVSPTLIQVGDNSTGFTLTETGPSWFIDSSQPLSDTWKNIRIDLSSGLVTGDSYVNGALVKTGQTIFFVSDLAHLPEGQTMLIRGILYGDLTLSAVPEPSSGLSMALGLLAIGWGAWRARQRG